MELGPQDHNEDGLLGPYSIIDSNMGLSESWGTLFCGPDKDPTIYGSI